MKKTFATITILASALVLAGCGTSPANQTPTANPNNSLWVSTDSGKTWVNNFLPNGKVDISSVDILSLAVNPNDSKNAYAGLRGPGILKTADGGLTWAYLPFQPQKVYGLDIDPADGKVIYASGVWQSRGKIFKSIDAGANWKEIYTTAANGPLVIALVVDRKNPGIVYATTSDNQMIKSTDAGATWKNIFTPTTPIIKITVDKFNDSLVYGLTQSGEIQKSSDGGQTFTNIAKNLLTVSNNNAGIDLIETDPGNGGWLYAGGQMGLFLSKDEGNTWAKIQILNNPQTFPVKALAVNPTNSRELIYGAAQAAYRSVDGGADWTAFQFVMGKGINMIKYAAADPTQLYLGFSK